MSTEIPQSVLYDYNPTRFQSDSAQFQLKGLSVIEEFPNRRKAGTSIRSRTLHLKDLQGQLPVQTIRLSEDEEYCTIGSKVHDGTPIREIKVNGTHIKVGEVKFDLSGKRLSQEVKAQQLSFLEPTQLYLDEAVTLPTDEENNLPESIDPSTVQFLLGISDIVRSPQKTLPADSVLEISKVFDQISPTSNNHPDI